MFMIAGLLGQLLFATAMARPATSVHTALQASGEDQAGGFHVDEVMDSRHVLS